MALLERQRISAKVLEKASTKHTQELATQVLAIVVARTN